VKVVVCLELDRDHACRPLALSENRRRNIAMFSFEFALVSIDVCYNSLLSCEPIVLAQ